MAKKTTEKTEEQGIPPVTEDTEQTQTPDNDSGDDVLTPDEQVQEDTPATSDSVIARSDSDVAISASTAEPEKKEYTVHGCRISHNGKVYNEGSKISLTADEAEKLRQFIRG